MKPLQRNGFDGASFFNFIAQSARQIPIVGDVNLQLVEKVLADFPAKLRKISKLVTQVPKFCDSDAKENPDGFLSHYLSLRILWPKRFFDSLGPAAVAAGPSMSGKGMVEDGV